MSLAGARLYAVRIFVRDFERCVHFYRTVLGLKPVCADAGIGWAEFDTGETHLALERADDDSVAMVGRFVGASIRVDDIDRVYRELSALNADFDAPPEAQPWG
ncbi:MAG: glyoxalase, partial [Proteobacteria bacterium]